MFIQNAMNNGYPPLCGTGLTLIILHFDNSCSNRRRISYFTAIFNREALMRAFYHVRGVWNNE